MEPIAWIDVIEQPHSLDCYGLNQRMALAAFHVWDESAGRMYTGASAFVRLWRALPGYRWLAHGIAALRLTPLLDRAYRIFAERHFRKRCREGACGV